MPLSLQLSRRILHIFHKDTISPCGIIYKDMRHRTHQFAVSQNRAAAHE